MCKIFSMLYHSLNTKNCEIRSVLQKAFLISDIRHITEIFSHCRLFGVTPSAHCTTALHIIYIPTKSILCAGLCISCYHVVELRTHTQTISDSVHSNSFHSLSQKSQKGFGADIKIIFAPTPPTHPPWNFFWWKWILRHILRLFYSGDIGSILKR